MERRCLVLLLASVADAWRDLGDVKPFSKRTFQSNCSFFRETSHDCSALNISAYHDSYSDLFGDCVRDNPIANASERYDTSGNYVRNVQYDPSLAYCNGLQGRSRCVNPGKDWEGQPCFSRDGHWTRHANIYDGTYVKIDCTFCLDYKSRCQ